MKKKTRDYAAVLRQEIASDPELRAIAEQDSFDTNVAVQIYEARTRKRLTQKQLADLIESKPGVISRMEDADYQGHSLRMLRKIADALDCTIGVEFYPRCKPADSTPLHASFKAEAAYQSQATAQVSFSVSGTAPVTFSASVSVPQVS